MKPSWLVPVLSTACASTLDVEGSFMHLCSDISLHPNTGVLSASCNLGSSDAVPVNTSVDLNGCLGWGPSLEPEPIKYSENEIYPSVNGRFSEYCGSCSLLKPGDSITQVGYILCSCSPPMSNIGLEATFDLAKVVSVGDTGYLQCLNAKQDCAASQAVATPPRPSVEDVLSLFGRNLAVSNSRAILDLIDNEPCEPAVRRLAQTLPEALPQTYNNSGFKACKDDYGLCCFKNHPEASEMIEGFKLINDSTYFYRFHYHQDTIYSRSTAWDKLASVFRICANPDRSKCVLPNTGPAWDFGEDATTTDPTITTTVFTTVTELLAGPARVAATQTTWSTKTTTLPPTIAVRQEQTASPLYTSEDAPEVHALLMNLLIQRQDDPDADPSTAPTTAPAQPTNSDKPAITLKQDTLDKKALARLIADHFQVRTKKPVIVSMRMIMTCSSIGEGISCSKQVGQSALSVVNSRTSRDVSFKQDLDFLELGNTIAKAATVNSPKADLLVDLIISVPCQKVRHFGLRCEEDSLLVMLNRDSQAEGHVAVRSPSALSKLSSNNGIVIDMSKVDVATLVNLMLAATNIDQVHKANLVLKVKALSCTSQNGSRGCSDVVVSLAEAGDAHSANQPRVAGLSSSSLDDKTKTRSTETVTKTKTEKGEKTTKTEKVTVTKTTTEKEPTTKYKSVTLTSIKTTTVTKPQKTQKTKSKTKTVTSVSTKTTTKLTATTSKGKTVTTTKVKTSTAPTQTKTSSKKWTSTKTSTSSKPASTKSKASTRTVTKTATSSRPTSSEFITSKSTSTKASTSSKSASTKSKASTRTVTKTATSSRPTSTELITSKSSKSQHKTKSATLTATVTTRTSSGASPQSTNAAPGSRPRSWITVLRE